MVQVKVLIRKRELDERIVVMVLLVFETIVKGHSAVGSVATGNMC